MRNCNTFFKLLLTSLIVMILFGCDSTIDKQTDACVDDIKQGLNDPNSLEVLSTKGIDLDNGEFRLKVEFTAKNKLGGRVRRSELCGFKTKDDTVLNPDDLFNEQRKAFRILGLN